jgi:tetratricopeptide (TPR) repeat protein
MSDFWDYRGWSRNEENNDWQDIHGENREYRADALLNRALSNGLEFEKLDKTITYLAAAADINREIERIPELLQCLLLLGDCYLNQEKGDEVAQVACEAEKIALQSFNDIARAKAVHLQGYNYYLQKKYSLAADHSASAGHLYESAFDNDEAYSVYSAAGRLYRWQDDRDKSIECFQNALRVARAEESLENITQAKTWIAFLQLRVKPFVDLDEAKTSLEVLNDELKLAKNRNSTWRLYDSALAWLHVFTDPLQAAKNFDLLIDISRSDKNTQATVENSLGRAYALGMFERSENYVQALRSVLAVLEDIDAPIAIIDVVKPLCDFYLENEQFQEAELIWARGRALAEKRDESESSIAYFDQMIALCIAEYAEPKRALDALESALPKTIEKPLPFDYEFALAKAYAANERQTESLIVIDRALSALGDGSTGKLEYAELHELKCDLLDKQGNAVAAKNEAKLSFDAYFDLNKIEKAKRLKAKYLMPQPGDANPETGAITLGNWG